MTRYFLEVAYKGTAYSGFQVQENAKTIQSVLEEAFCTIQRVKLQKETSLNDENGIGWQGLTGSSRTDAGVHAWQNFFHFDYANSLHPALLYKMNAVLPDDIVVKSIIPVSAERHSRFDAVSREYEYYLHRFKNPFIKQISYLYPYPLKFDLLQQAAAIIAEETNFFSFSKTNTQVSNFSCQIYKSSWLQTETGLSYNIAGNRFLRGMVRLLTATQLKVGRGQITIAEFKNLFITNRKCGYSVPAHGLFLKAVNYPQNFFSMQ